MKKGLIWATVGCLVLCLSTCGRSGPTSPLSPAYSVDQTKGQPEGGAAGIVVTSSKAAYFVGETETFTACLMSDGGTIPTTGGTWTTDTPEVATVNEAGLVTIVGQGFVNISFSSGGVKGSKQVWGRVDCRGAWSGTYSIERCQIVGDDFPDAQFCETHRGSGLPIGLVLTETGEVLQGTIKLGDLATPFVAKPLLDGSLEMEGEVYYDPYAINVAVGCDWTPSGPSFRMMLYYYRGNRGEGQAMLTCDIALSKTGAGQ